MKVLIADTFQDEGVEALRDAGCEVVHDSSLEGEALRDAVERTACEVLIVRGTRVAGAAMEVGTSLSLVVRAGAGYDAIDVAAASRRSILVANCVGKNAVAVAELTFALILALDRRVVENVIDLRQGVWNKKEYARSRGLKDRTLGIVGMGQIGRAVARRALAFEMRVTAWSRSLTDAMAVELNVTRCDSPAEVADRCDILTVHVSSTPQTAGLIDADVLGRLKPNSIFVNTARHDVVDYAALTAAVKDRGLRVGLDVYPNEPPVPSSAFSPGILGCGGVVYGTHHIGASTEQAQESIAAETVRIVRTYQETGRVINCVNLRETVPAAWCLGVRHLNRPGVLAHVLHELSHAHINVEEMQNIITEGAEAACAHIHLDAEPPADVLERIRTGCESVLAVTLTKGSDG